MSRSVAVGLAAVLAASATMAVASPARAYEIKDFSANIVKADGTTFESQAGGVPHQGIISYNTVVNQQASAGVPPLVEQAGSTKRIRVTVPPGLVPNPQSIPECTDQQLHDRACPPASQVGMVMLRLRTYLPTDGTPSLVQTIQVPPGTKGWIGVRVGIFNMERSNGSQLARFAFDSGHVSPTGHMTEIIGAMRPDDNRLYFTIDDIPTPTSTSPQTPPLLAGATMTFWGKPGSAAHDAQRGSGQLLLISTDAPGISPGVGFFPTPAGTPLPANTPLNIPIGGFPPTGAAGITNRDATFLRNPTSCSGPQKAELELSSWQGEKRNADDTVGEETNGLQGCDQVPFSTSTSFGPSPMQADAPVPLGVTLNVPQAGDTDPLATAHVKNVAVTLPPGISISPSAANGLEACTDAQFAKGTNDTIACPEASKIGTVSIDTPVLPSALQGTVYVGQPLPGNRYRLFLNADGFGISIRLKGDVRPDPVSGQITAHFDDNPQLPFSRFKLDFNGGSRAIVASPQDCATVSGASVLAPWSGNAADRSNANVTVTGCNGNQFAPGFAFGTSTLVAGAQTAVTADFSRDDTQQPLSEIAARLPLGMLASIKGVERCGEAQIRAESCPAASRIGTVTAKAGPGATPFELSAPVYLTWGYNGGSFGAVVIMHVVAGPYDLGNIVVRQSLRIDPDTAQVSVVSDPLPQIKEGVPLRLRNLRLHVDRANFMRNPTSCGTQKVKTDLGSVFGTAAYREASLSFVDCSKLAFKPRISMKLLGGKGQMKKFKYPALRATVTQAGSQAGIRYSKVTLPKHVALAAKNAKGLCEVKDAEADKCPKESIVGHAIATTPLLNDTLKGPVYFVKGERKDPKSGRIIATLPTFYVPLRGETTIHLRAKTDVSKDRLVTTFPAIPDAPITKFEFNIKGGKNGIVQATRDLCAAKTFKATVRFRGHNGAKPGDLKPRISPDCGKKKSTKKK